MASLDILRSNPFNLKKIKLRKSNIRNILGLIKNFVKSFMTHQYIPKVFHDFLKNPPHPLPHTSSTYLMYDLLFFWELRFFRYKKEINSTEHFNLPRHCLYLPVSLLKIKKNAIIFQGSKQIPERNGSVFQKICKSSPEHLIL